MTDAAAQRRSERPATGAQLYTLNRLGLLCEAMGLTSLPPDVVARLAASGPVVSARRARLVLTAAQERGDWQGTPLRVPPTPGETVAVARYNRARERRQERR